MMHPFEEAGLGKAPFRFAGAARVVYQAAPDAPVQPGGSCDYCMNAITNHFYVESADGRRFKVGSECIHKASDQDLSKPVDRELRRLKREQRHANEARKIEELRGWLADPEIRARLKAQPHPHPSFTDKTRLDWAEWMIDNSGNAGMLRVYRAIKKEIGND